MKINFKIVFLVVISFTFKGIAQQPVISLEDKDGTRMYGAYYKDTNNVLNNFEGTWLYTNGSTSLKIILQKRVMQSINGVYHEDLIIGEYQYIENGIEKFNSLQRLNQDVGHIYNHGIDGNNILTTPFFLNCTDCAPNEKRLDLGITDNINERYGTVVVKKTTVSGQEAIKIYLGFAIEPTYNDDPPGPPACIPAGWYILIKQ